MVPPALRPIYHAGAAVAAVPLRIELEADVGRLRGQLRTGILLRLDRERTRLQRAGCSRMFATSIITTVFFGVPRVWEKFYSGVHGKISAATGIKAKLVKWAMGVGRKATEVRSRGGTPGGLPRAAAAGPAVGGD